MTNEAFLIASYFAVGAATLVVPVLIYLSLRGGMAAVLGLVGHRAFSRLTRALFLPALWIAAVLGFASTPFIPACSSLTYPAVVNNRAYIVRIERQRFAGSLEWVAYGALGWAAVVTMALGRKK